MNAVVLLVVLAATLSGRVDRSQRRSGADAGSRAPGAPALTATAQAIYADARPRLLQIRTLVQSAGSQSSIGSGFVVSADGFAMTNYHVVSQYALEPATYRLEYAAPDGSRGALRVHAIDVANDLAVLQLDRTGLPFFEFDARAVGGTLPKGERLFAMGNPLDLGFTIVEGTYNGLVEKSYNERIHFSGALNPGMSGGPTVTDNGRVAGVNVAKQIGGDLVSFLVPARHAVALIERARQSGPMTPAHAREDIARQLAAWQSGLYAAVAAKGLDPDDARPLPRAGSGGALLLVLVAHQRRRNAQAPRPVQPDRLQHTGGAVRRRRPCDRPDRLFACVRAQRRPQPVPVRDVPVAAVSVVVDRRRSAASASRRRNATRILWRPRPTAAGRCCA